MHADERRAGEVRPRPDPDDPGERVDGDRLQHETFRPKADGAFEVERIVESGRLTERAQDPGGLIGQAAEREGERRRRGGVDPLHVVDRDHDRPVRGKSPEGAERRHRYRTSVGSRPRAPGPQQRDVERAALRLGQRPLELVQRVPQQIAETCIGEPGLGSGGPRDHDAVSARLRDRETCLPHGALPDARWTGDEDGVRAAGIGRQELGDGLELSLAAHDVTHRSSRLRSSDPDLAPILAGRVSGRARARLDLADERQAIARPRAQREELREPTRIDRRGAVVGADVSCSE